MVAFPDLKLDPIQPEILDLIGKGPATATRTRADRRMKNIVLKNPVFIKRSSTKNRLLNPYIFCFDLLFKNLILF